MSALVTPRAPSSIAWSTSIFILSSCCAVGATLPSPITYCLIVPVPTNEEMFRSNAFFSRGVHVFAKCIPTLYLISPWPSCICFFMVAFNGAKLDSPKTSIVTPCLTSLNPRLSSNNVSSEWPIMLLKPGYCHSFASISSLPLPPRSPIAAMVSALMAISPLYGALRYHHRSWRCG